MLTLRGVQSLRTSRRFGMYESSSGCVRVTVATCADLRYRIANPEQGVAERSTEAHAYNLFDLRARYADVAPVDQGIVAL